MENVKEALETVTNHFNEYKKQTERLRVLHEETLSKVEILSTTSEKLIETLQSTAICILKFQDEIPEELKELGVMLNEFNAKVSLAKLGAVKDA